MKYCYYCLVKQEGKKENQLNIILQLDIDNSHIDNLPYKGKTIITIISITAIVILVLRFMFILLVNDASIIVIRIYCKIFMKEYHYYYYAKNVNLIYAHPKTHC